ncbi:MAG: ATP-dependent DNA helicase [Methanocella sp. PtaU1.Bin125]|nr:MAG: ATP-dependent DNA helicase [Methanocella sp. PtaU1.Bin125]
MADRPYLSFFPKPAFYPNQESAMETIYRALAAGKLVLFEGACGTGKTLSALAPALAVGREQRKKVVIATPVHQQMVQFVEEAREVRAKAGIKAVSFIGKEKMCPAGKSVHACKSLTIATEARIEAEKAVAKLRNLMKSDDWKRLRPDERHDLTASLAMQEDALRRLKSQSCEYLYETLRGVNDKFKQWLFDDVRSSEDVRERSEDEGKCGYELLKENLKDADLIICNYHHLIKPEFRDRFLTVLGCKISDLIVIFDEAHNLEEQARSASLPPLDEIALDAAEKEVTRLKPDGESYDEASYRVARETALRTLGGLRDTLRKTYAEKLSFGQAERISPRGIDIRVRDPSGSDDYFCIALREKLLTSSGIRLEDAVNTVKMMGTVVYSRAEEDFKSGRTPVFEGSKLLDVGVFLDEYVQHSSDIAHYPIVTVHKSQDGRLYATLELCNCVPGEVSGPLLEGPGSAVLMSATLQPFDTLKDVLQIKRDTVEIIFGSPFPPERRKTFAVDVGPLMYSNRGDLQVEKTLATLFEDIIAASAGNVLFFFPTAEEAKKYARLIKVDVPVLVPEKGLSPEKLKKQFFGYGDAGSKAVMMAYLWGTLTEGVDYRYDRCRTVVVVGVGLQNYRDDRSQAIINAYESLYPGKGMEYVVSQPAVKKIRQACGRVIRSPTDYGVMILVDRRYTRPFSDRYDRLGYYHRFPAEETREYIEVKPGDIRGAMEQFFKTVPPVPVTDVRPSCPALQADGAGKPRTAETRRPAAAPARPKAPVAPADTDPIGGMIARLKSANVSQRWKAAMDLGATGNARAVEPLIRALDDGHPRVVLNAVWSLAEIGDLRAIDPLHQATRHRDRSVREAAKKAVKRIYKRG